MVAGLSGYTAWGWLTSSGCGSQETPSAAKACRSPARRRRNRSHHPAAVTVAWIDTFSPTALKGLSARRLRPVRRPCPEFPKAAPAPFLQKAL